MILQVTFTCALSLYRYILNILKQFCYYVFLFLTVMCTDCLLFLDDFNPNKIPSSNGRKCYISSSRVSEMEDNSRTRDRLKRLMKGLVIGESKPRYSVT